MVHEMVKFMPHDQPNSSSGWARRARCANGFYDQEGRWGKGNQRTRPKVTPTIQAGEQTNR